MKLTLFVLSVLICLLSAARPAWAEENGALSFALPIDAPTTQAPPPDHIPPDDQPNSSLENSTAASPATVIAAVSSDDSGALTFPQPDLGAISPTTPELPATEPPATEPPASRSPAAELSPLKAQDADFQGAEASPGPIVALAQKPKEATVAPAEQEAIFTGGSDSLVARTVGAAEGTRTTDGSKTDNYYGHTDPGDGKWNVGTFSYSHTRDGTTITTPEAADRHYLDRLHDRAAILQRKATQAQVELTFEELLNGIDLANQAPLAVTEPGGFVERLAESKQQKGLSGEVAILESRVWAFWDPQTGRWNAPGLRAYDDISKEESIRRDQERRMDAIAAALAAYQQENHP